MSGNRRDTVPLMSLTKPIDKKLRSFLKEFKKIQIGEDVMKNPLITAGEICNNKDLTLQLFFSCCRMLL